MTTKKDTKFSNLHNLELFFTDEKTCLKHIELKRWNNEPACTSCGSLNLYKLKAVKITSVENVKSFSMYKQVHSLKILKYLL